MQLNINYKFQLSYIWRRVLVLIKSELRCKFEKLSRKVPTGRRSFSSARIQPHVAQVARRTNHTSPKPHVAQVAGRRSHTSQKPQVARRTSHTSHKSHVAQAKRRTSRTSHKPHVAQVARRTSRASQKLHVAQASRRTAANNPFALKTAVKPFQL